MKTPLYCSVRKGLCCAILVLILILSCSFTTLGSVAERDDGLIISQLDARTTKNHYEYVTMVLKTGYGHEPQNKQGLNSLTNELVYLLLRTSCALEVNYYPFAEYTVFTFVVWPDDFTLFCAELDGLIRLDTLLLYDLCNELINLHLHTAETLSNQAQSILYELLYGPEHPYLNKFKPDYTKLSINEVNNWFRAIYKPNNLIISTTAELPVDFLKRPTGREMKQKVLVAAIPPGYADGPAQRFLASDAPLSTVFLAFPGPQPQEAEFFTGRIVQKYLHHQLWLSLRQDLGYCYDLQVNYSYLNEPTAPTITIAFQVLPENTEPALDAVFRVLEKLETTTLTPEEIQSYREQEEKAQQRNYDVPGFLSLMDALGVQLDLAWATDYEQYCANLKLVSADGISSFAQTYFPKWRLSVVGPVPAGRNKHLP